MMNDLREYRFGDWYRLFLRVIPAFLLASFVVIAPMVALLTLVWFFLAIPS